MKSVRVTQFGGPDVLQVYNNVPIPEPTGTQILIEVKAAGINPLDTYIRSGAFFIKPDLPYTPGGDAAGLVKAIGTSVTRFKPGDRVFVIMNKEGTYAEYTLADEHLVQPLSEKLTFQQGAGIGVPCYTAYSALCFSARSWIRPDNTVLIHGASGAVGIACVQMAVARGMTVIGTAGSEQGLRLVLQQGATAAFNHKTAGYVDQIKAATNDKGPDLIVEMLANVNLDKDIGMINNNGCIVIVSSRGTVTIDPLAMMIKKVTIIGMEALYFTEDEWREMHAGVAAGINQGWLRPIICKEYSIDEAPQAHDDIINAGATLGKRVMVF